MFPNGKTRTAKLGLYSETGQTGLLQWAGRIHEDFLTELRGKEGYKRYNEMRLNSPVIGALLTAIEQAVRGVEWTYSSDQGDEDPRLELLNAARDNMTHGWDNHIIEALTMLPFGYSIFETIYERVDSQILWRKFAFRGQDTVWKWDLDEHGGIQGFWQQATPSFTNIPIERLSLYRARVEKNNPEGRSILRAAWIPYYYAKNLTQIEGIAYERNLAGFPVISMPADANTDLDDSNSDASNAAKQLRNLRVDEQSGFLEPEGWKFRWESPGNQTGFQYINEAIKRHEGRMLMSALAQFLLLGMDKVGSLALSSDQTDFFTMSVNAVADIIAETHTKHAIPRLLKLNGLDDTGLQLEHTPAGDVDLGQLADFLQKTGSKITWTPEDEAWLRSVARLPDLTVEEIEMEREKKAALAAPLFQPSQPEPTTNGSASKFQSMNFEQFQADEAYPEDDERTKWEKRWQRKLLAFFDGQRERIIKGVKRA